MLQLQDQDSRIFVGQEVLASLDVWVENFKVSSLFILLDTNTQLNCLPLLLKQAPLLSQKAKLICIPAGEENKNLENLAFIWKVLSESLADRHSLLINLGGGVIGDMGGFAAATYQRGIPFVLIPTTLLAMADASVGGKTGIDFRGLKNQIGLFMRAKAVFICPLFLQTLSKAQFQSGAMEIFKMALLVKDTSWKEILYRGFEPTQFKMEDLILAITAKLQIVASDFKESKQRKILNLGHTFGHAFESLSLAQNRPISHGYAVALGLVCELYFSTLRLGFSVLIQKEIETELLKIFPYFSISENDICILKTSLLQDKKNNNQKVYPVLLTAIGVAELTQEISQVEIEKVFYYYQKLEVRTLNAHA
ncbi:MAG: 3-dehydroquinate synthase family protein [Bacteroidales bacterium]